MRRKLMLALAIAAVASLGVAAVASAVSTTLRAGDLITTFGGNTSPKALPKKNFVPVTTHIFGKIKTSDGTHPSAFREAAVNIDKDVKVNVKGFPVCKAGQLEARDTKAAKRVCGKTILGEGHADAEIAFPEQKPIKVPSPLLVFNGGEHGGKVTLLIHTFITVPAPTAIVTTVTIKRSGTRDQVDRQNSGGRGRQRFRARLRLQARQDLQVQGQEGRLLRSQVPGRRLQGQRAEGAVQERSEGTRRRRTDHASRAASRFPARRRASATRQAAPAPGRARRGGLEAAPFSWPIRPAVRRCAGRRSSSRCRRSVRRGPALRSPGPGSRRSLPGRRRRSA